VESDNHKASRITSCTKSLAIDTLEIRCDACGGESPQSERRDYPIHVLLHDRGQWEFVPVNPILNAKATGVEAFELASTYLPKE